MPLSFVGRHARLVNDSQGNPRPRFTPPLCVRGFSLGRLVWTAVMKAGGGVVLALVRDQATSAGRAWGCLVRCGTHRVLLCPSGFRQMLRDSRGSTRPEEVPRGLPRVPCYPPVVLLWFGCTDPPSLGSPTQGPHHHLWDARADWWPRCQLGPRSVAQTRLQTPGAAPNHPGTIMPRKKKKTFLTCTCGT